MKVDRESDGGWQRSHVVAWGTTVVVGALAVMFAWGWWIQSPLAFKGRADVGAFGDAFAPVTGLFTAMALGAALVSVFMQRAELEEQRKEMREARRQYELQSKALAEANKLAERANVLADRANDLARRAQILEASRQVDDVNTLAVDILRARGQTDPMSDEIQARFADPTDLWFDLRTLAKKKEVPAYWDEIMRGELVPLLYRFETLESIITDLAQAEDESGDGS